MIKQQCFCLWNYETECLDKIKSRSTHIYPHNNNISIKKKKEDLLKEKKQNKTKKTPKAFKNNLKENKCRCGQLQS